MRLRVGARTDTGRVRTLNEDSFVVQAAQGLFLVCDGMGGAPAGEVASQMAAHVILERLGTAGATVEPTSADDTYLPQTNRLADAVRWSNQVIYDQGQIDPLRAEMGTTVVSAWVAHHIASVAHVGDSRAYLWHDNHLELLTCDHGEDNVLLRVLGGGPEVDVDLSEIPVQPGNFLLLCSDGLTRMVPDDLLAETIGRLRDPQRICDFLIDAANRNGGRDNITVVVVEIVGSWWRHFATRWTRLNRGRVARFAE
jgi:protein phosphatase